MIKLRVKSSIRYKSIDNHNKSPVGKGLGITAIIIGVIIFLFGLGVLSGVRFMTDMVLIFVLILWIVGIYLIVKGIMMINKANAEKPKTTIKRDYDPNERRGAI